tara:strand:+ start:2801 stop:3217 length:417 start_codon:yes stop_codon:yes gene_type:complete
MRIIEVKVVAYNINENGCEDFCDNALVERIFDIRDSMYTLSFVERWAKFLREFDDMEDDEGIEPTNSPHNYDAWDFYEREFDPLELIYIQDHYMPEGDADFGCGPVVKVSVLDNGEEKILYESEIGQYDPNEQLKDEE